MDDKVIVWNANPTLRLLKDMFHHIPSQDVATFEIVLLKVEILTSAWSKTKMRKIEVVTQAE